MVTSSGSNGRPSSSRRPATTVSCAAGTLVLYANQSTPRGSSCSRIASTSPVSGISCGSPNVRSTTSSWPSSARSVRKKEVTGAIAASAARALSDSSTATALPARQPVM